MNTYEAISNQTEFFLCTHIEREDYLYTAQCFIFFQDMLSSPFESCFLPPYYKSPRIAFLTPHVILQIYTAHPPPQILH